MNGPWHVDPSPLAGRDGDSAAIVDGHGHVVADVIADADVVRLFAAAPDLLAACEAALAEDSGLACAHRLRAACDAARGEPCATT